MAEQRPRAPANRRNADAALEPADATPSSLMRAFEATTIDAGELEALRREVGQRRRAAKKGEPDLARALRRSLLRLAGAVMLAGATDEARELIEETVEISRRLQEDEALAACSLARGDLWMLRGEVDAALRLLQAEVLPILQRGSDPWATANVRGRIADAHERRGEWDEALRIRREEVLAAFERLGDALEAAVSMGLPDAAQIREFLRRYKLEEP